LDRSIDEVADFREVDDVVDLGIDFRLGEPERMGLNPAPSAMSAPTLPRISMRPASGLIRPLSILSKVVLPAPLRPMSPRHSPRRSSNDTLLTA
jgi:hypothetical protein